MLPTKKTVIPTATNKSKRKEYKMRSNKIINSFKIQIQAKSANEAFSRAIISGFACQLDPTIEELCDIKTAVSEAVTNCIVHAYSKDTPERKKVIRIQGFYDDANLLTVKITDYGCGISDIKRAMEPLYTTGNDERSGMGFPIMESFTDKLTVKSIPGKGTTVIMRKYIGKEKNDI